MAGNEVKKIGVLTSGGDAPGMNAAVRAVVRTAVNRGIQIAGIYEGYQGLIENNIHPLGYNDVCEIINRGGTMLYSARSKEFMTPAGIQKAIDNCHDNGIEGIVTIGGDGTFRGARELSRLGIPCIGIPATIDNDISATEYSIGFDTALNTVIEFVDKIRDTCMSHARCSVVEVMGRDAGHIALETGLAVGAIAIAIREKKFDMVEMIKTIKSAQIQGRRQFIVIVAEGTGLTEAICRMISYETSIETRAAVLAHVQRGGSPSARDRVLASRMGYHAVEIIRQGMSSRVVAVQQNKMCDFDIEEALMMKKELDFNLLDIANTLSL